MTASSERDPAAAPARLRLPDFFIVGHPKSGTTALYEMLRRHPQIYMGELKEPWFFATDMPPRFLIPRAGTPPKTLQEYAALFAGARADQRVGEGTSTYLFSKTAAAAIAEVAPAARIVAILREPVSFLRSYHLQLLQNHIETEQDLGRAIALEQDRSEGRHVPSRADRPQLLQYTGHVRYVEQLRRYEERFGREQMLVLIYDDFRSDNRAAIGSVLRFLGVDDSHEVDVMDVNPTFRMRSRRLDDLVHAVSVGRGPLTRAARATVKALAPRRIRRELLGLTRRRIVYGAPRPPDEQLTIDLRRRFQGEVVALGEYLDRDLVKLWRYDEIE